jgi:molecular chaperone GrpE (heat shock protein)
MIMEKTKKPLSVIDRRRVGKTEDAIATESNLKPGFVQELEERTKRAEATLLQRIAALDAEAQRSRERIRAELEQRYARKERDLLGEVLGLLDDVDRAAELTSEVPAVAQGLGILSARVDHFLKTHHCEKFVPEGEPFDPERMEATAVLDGPAGKVLRVFQAGYTCAGEILRPAHVAVGRG